MANFTRVTEFLLTRISDMWELRILHAMLFLLMYVATLLGNILIVIVTTFDKTLHTPMYFFLRNLSVLDMCYISVTVPKACIIFLLDNRVISMTDCAAQIFFVVLFAFIEMLFLTIMAYDRYVAICHPLHYPVIMNTRICVQMTLVSIFSGVVYSGFHTGSTFQLTFCHSNVVQLYFCDIPSLLKLSCSDIFSNEMEIFVSAILVAGGCFFLIIMSYVQIFSTVLKFPTRGERGKAFSTCVPHIIVVTVFATTGAAVYINPISNSPTFQDMIISVFYCIIPPLLNPIIYSLRNKQIKGALKRIIRGTF
ncbi:PREDICTED: olfactory receptor 14C36-like [Elephantulus edwardii]|uniref:olfactory receptor 14C36-like n=1 Tax=Elephantulus edwardii TaxID=28737 RepID=UPI0003F08624|nr:PREDICTED: olfactory receptor 14C36-like [Elephantulus edwardii]